MKKLIFGALLIVSQKAVAQLAPSYLSSTSAAGVKLCPNAWGGDKLGTYLALYACTPTQNEQFDLSATSQLQMAGTQFCVAPNGTANGSKLYLVQCSTDPNQIWSYSGQNLVHKATGKCMDINAFSYVSGQQLQIYTCNGGINQKFASSPLNSPVTVLPVYGVMPDGTVAKTTTLSGQAPYSAHVAAGPLVTNSCMFNQTAWELAGMHNLCSVDWQKWSLPAVIPTGSFMGGTTPVQQVCFHNFLTNQPYDAATTRAINEIAACVHSANSAAVGSMYTQDYAWDFGDAGTPFNAVKGFNAAHVYYNPGTYTIKLNGGASVNVTVTPNTRTPVMINTQADMNALIAVGSLAKVSNRWIQLKRGMTFNVTNPIYVYANDWLTAQPGTGALPILTNTTNTPQMSFYQAGGAPANILIELVDIEHPGGSFSTNPQLSQVYGNIHNIAFKDIVFKGLHKAFDLNGTGILIQNVGSVTPWTDTQLNSNFVMSSASLLSLYGNNVYVSQADANTEPGIRSNYGQYISLVGNNLGGWIGKQDWISDRGAINFYMGNNVMRGGIANTQNGNGQDPCPAAIEMNAVFESNEFDTTGIALEQGTSNTRIINNKFFLRDRVDSTDPFYVLYPAAPYSLAFAGAAFGIQTQNTLVSGNTFVSLLTHPKMGGEALQISDQTGSSFTGNIFWSATYSPFVLFGTMPLPSFSGNVFYVNKLTDVPTTVAPGNTVKLNSAWTPPTP